MVTQATSGNKNALVPPDSNHPNSLRTTRPSWLAKKVNKALNLNSDGTPKDNAAVDDLRKNGPRIILFNIGGISYSEIRGAYEVLKEFQRDVIIGRVFSHYIIKVRIMFITLLNLLKLLKSCISQISRLLKFHRSFPSVLTINLLQPLKLKNLKEACFRKRNKNTILFMLWGFV